MNEFIEVILNKNSGGLTLRGEMIDNKENGVLMKSEVGERIFIPFTSIVCINFI